MKILFLVRPDLFRIKAGDTIQVLNLAKALNNLGLDITISTELRPNLKKYDLVHCFNILRFKVCYWNCLWVKEQNKPLFLTPIYWNLAEYLQYNKKHELEWWYQRQKKMQKIFNLIDLIVPNAELEWQQIKKDFQINLPYRIIYNGVDPIFLKATGNTKRRDVLAVGRIHPRKNQLRLIKALKGSNLSLKIVGDINHQTYYRQCLKEAQGEKVNFYKGRKQRNLVKFYQEAKVHVLASWYDTPGLVNLEAALAACNLVTTNRGTAKEYLKDYAFYCEPNSVESIREAVIKANKVESNKELFTHIKNNFTWAKIAKKAIIIYQEFIK